MNDILFTGGSGVLGTEMKKLFKESYFPTSSEFNILDVNGMIKYIKDNNLKINNIVHMAAVARLSLIDEDPIYALSTNIIGTSNVVFLCSILGCKITYISTDYVFRGDIGNYKEGDPMYPVNKYGWSKLGGECAVKLYDNHLIIRTSFGPLNYDYDSAPIDQFTSREPVDIISKKIRHVIEQNVCGEIHVGGHRKSIYEYVKSLDYRKKIKKISIKDIEDTKPKDTSLNCSKFKEL